MIRPFARRFRQDETGATSIEFGMLALPFVMSIMMVAQAGIESMTHAEMDGAIQLISEELQTTRFSPAPTAARLRDDLCQRLSQGRSCPETLIIELAPLKSASGASWKPPVNQVDLGADNEILLLRAQMEGSLLGMLSFSRTQFYAARLVRRP